MPRSRALPVRARAADAPKRILGRERNLIVMPDGTRHWPLVGFSRFREIAPIRQYQFIQHDRERIEVNLVSDAPLSPAQEAELRAVIQGALGHPFAVEFTYFADRIPRGRARSSRSSSARSCPNRRSGRPGAALAASWLVGRSWAAMCRPRGSPAPRWSASAATRWPSRSSRCPRDRGWGRRGTSGSRRRRSCAGRCPSGACRSGARRRIRLVAWISAGPHRGEDPGRDGLRVVKGRALVRAELAIDVRGGVAK